MTEENDKNSAKKIRFTQIEYRKTEQFISYSVHGNRVGEDLVTLGDEDNSTIAVGRGFTAQMAPQSYTVVGDEVPAHANPSSFSSLKDRVLDSDLAEGDQTTLVDYLTQLEAELAQGEAADMRTTRQLVADIMDIYPDIRADLWLCIEATPASKPIKFLAHKMLA